MVCDFPALKWIIVFSGTIFWGNFRDKKNKFKNKKEKWISINSLEDFPLFSCKVVSEFQIKKEDLEKRLHKFLWENDTENSKKTAQQ